MTEDTFGLIILDQWCAKQDQVIQSVFQQFPCQQTGLCRERPRSSLERTLKLPTCSALLTWQHIASSALQEHRAGLSWRASS